MLYSVNIYLTPGKLDLLKNLNLKIIYTAHTMSTSIAHKMRSKSSKSFTSEI